MVVQDMESFAVLNSACGKFGRLCDNHKCTLKRLMHRFNLNFNPLRWFSELVFSVKAYTCTCIGIDYFQF